MAARTPAGHWPATLFAVSLILRLAHLATIANAPFFTHLGLDPLAYDEWGRRIAAGAWLGDRIFYQDPLYPYFLGVVYSLAGHHPAIAAGLQLVLGALVAPFIYLAARTAFDRRAAVAAGLLAALYAQSLFYEGTIEKTWLAVVLIAAAQWTLAAALGARPGGRGLLWWGATGFLFGLACLVRGNLLLLLPALAVWVLLDPLAHPEAASAPARLRSPAGWRRALALAVGAGLVLGASTVRNRVVGGEWVISTSQGGQNFYIGNNPANRNGQYDPLPFVGANPKFEEKGFAREAERRLGRPLSPTEVSSYWYGEAFAWIRARPGDWLRLTALKAANFRGAYEIPDNLDFYLVRDQAPVLRLPLPGFGTVGPLALLGLIWSWRRPGWPRALLLSIAIGAATVIGFFVFARYRMPVLPALLPFAGYGLVEAARRLRSAWLSGDALRLARHAGLVLLAFAFVHLPVRAPRDSTRYRVARALRLPAIAETTAVAHYNLGLGFASAADENDDDPEALRRAEAEFREALRQDPRYADVYAELGKVLARQGKDADAIAVYRQALTVEPDRPRTWHVLGLLQRRTGDLAGAEASFRQALRLDPRRADSATRLGEILLGQGRRTEAASWFRRALSADPNDAEAAAGLRAAERSS